MSLSVNGSSSSSIVAHTTETAETKPVTTTADVSATKETSAGVGAVASGFDTTTSTTAAADAAPTRGTEVASLLSTPEKVSSSDCVRAETKVDSIVQAALPTEREAVRAHFEKAASADLDAAFTNVLKATQAEGTRSVELGPFTGNVVVAADGKVNGAALPSDKELAVAGELSNLSQDDRRAQLRQVGVDEAFLASATDTQVVRAFNEVELARRFGGPGEHSLSLEYTTRRQVEGTSGEDAQFETVGVTKQVSFTVGAGGTVGQVGAALGRPSSEAALRDIRTRELAEWPAGRPEDRPSTVTANESVKFATLVSLLEPAKAKELTEARQYLSNESINAAYAQFLEAKSSPGQKSISFTLEATRGVPTGEQTESGEVVRMSPVSAFSVDATFDVSADGKVNGKPVLADEVVRLAKQTEALPSTVKDLLLKNAGVSDEWLNGATGEKDLVLAQLRLAAKSPGEHVIDLSFDRHDDAHSESGGTLTTRRGSLTLAVDDKGQVGGKPLNIDAAIATHATLDKMPMGEKRLMLSQLGLPAEVVRGIGARDATDVLTNTSMFTTTPGDHSFAFGVGGDSWQMAVRIGEGGKIEGVGAQKIPEQSFGRQFFDFACTVISVAFPVVAPIVGAVRTAVAYEQGQRGLGLFASAASAFAGLSGMADASFAAAANSFSQVVSGVNGVYQAVKHGDPLGGFSSLVSLASSVGDLSGTQLGSNFDLLKTLGQVAGGARDLLNGNVTGLAGQAFGAVTTHENAVARQAAEDAAELVRLENRTTGRADEGTASTGPDFGLGGARFGDSGTSTVRLGGTDGDEVSGGSSVDQATVRQIDNEIFGQVVRVRPGDNLTRIAANTLGDASLAPEVYAWNAAKLGTDPNRIPAGVDLEMPPEFFRLSPHERAAFYQMTHIAPVTTGSGSVGFTDNRDARDLRFGSGTGAGSPPLGGGGTAPATRPGSTEYIPLEPNSMSPEWGGYDPNAVSGSTSGPAFLMGSKLKFELTAGTFKGEVALGPENGLTVKGSNGNVWDKSVMLKTGPLRFTAEPSIMVDPWTRTFSIEGKVQGAVGPVAVALKGSIDDAGNYKLDAPTISADPGWISAGFKVFGFGVQLKLETGPLSRTTGAVNPNTGAPSSDLDYLNGYHAP